MERILKIDDERQRLYGIALVADEVDRQGDVVSDSELEEAACRAILNGCVVKVEHDGPPRGKLVASWPLTKQIGDALGIALPGGRSVWLVGLQVDDPATWAEVLCGNVGDTLSIAGTAQRRRR
jgi:Putative phage serine protease XkdF